MNRTARTSMACDVTQVRDTARLRALAEVSDAVLKRESQTLRLREQRLARDTAELERRQRISPDMARRLIEQRAPARKNATQS